MIFTFFFKYEKQKNSSNLTRTIDSLPRESLKVKLK